MLQLIVVLLVGSILLLSHYTLLFEWHRHANNVEQQWHVDRQVTLAASQWLALQSHYQLQCPNHGVEHTNQVAVLTQSEAAHNGFVMKSSGSGQYLGGPIVLMHALGAPVTLSASVAGLMQVTLPNFVAIKKRDQLLISDCAQAQVADIRRIVVRTQSQQLQLQQPISTTFVNGALAYPLKTWAIYLGQSSSSGSPSLYVMTADGRRYEWVGDIEHMAAKSVNGAIEVALQSGTAKEQIWLSRKDLY